MTAKRPTAAEKAQLLHQSALDRLRTLRESGREPPTIEQLATDLARSPAELLKVVTRKGSPGDFLIAAKHVGSPVSLAANPEWLAASSVLLEFVAARARDKRVGTGRSLRSDAKKLVADAGIEKRIAAELVTRVAAMAASGELQPAMAELLWPSPQEVSRTLVTALRERWESSSEVEPEGLGALLARTALDARLDPVKRALKSREFLDAMVLCVGRSAKEPAYVPVEWCERAVPALVRTGLDRLAASRVTTLFAGSAIAAAIVRAKDIRVRVERELERLAELRALPAWLGWLRDKGKRRYFRRVDIEGGDAGRVTPSTTGSTADDRVEQCVSEKGVVEKQEAVKLDAVKLEVAASDVGAREELRASEGEEFVRRFDAAFDRLDARSGGRNFVKVGELRRELNEYSREAFDAGLRALRIADRYAMESAHGGAVRLSDEELRAGIREGSSLLIYVSRK